ncbi:MAG: phosphatase PAP2 family protein [Candidatus Micrarchaeota archaeon]|nr:phosphatase PAP2 family protein [Candidatus Micrarchaeota archaeon]
MQLPEPAASAFGLARGAVLWLSVFLNRPEAFAVVSAALLVFVSIAFGEQRRIFFAATAVAIGILLGAGMKAFLHEERPCLYAPGKIDCPLDFSLPSLHSLVAFTLAIVAVGSASFPIYLSYALFVAFSRVYLGVHTTSEVAAGLALAFFACVLSELLWSRTKWGLPKEVRLRRKMDRL